MDFLKDIVVYDRGRSEGGTTTGVTRPCRLSGCTGIRIGVRWLDGRLSWPCTKGMTYDGPANEWVID